MSPRFGVRFGVRFGCPIQGRLLALSGGFCRYREKLRQPGRSCDPQKIWVPHTSHLLGCVGSDDPCPRAATAAPLRGAGRARRAYPAFRLRLHAGASSGAILQSRLRRSYRREAWEGSGAWLRRACGALIGAKHAHAPLHGNSRSPRRPEGLLVMTRMRWAGDAALKRRSSTGIGVWPGPSQTQARTGHPSSCGGEPVSGHGFSRADRRLDFLITSGLQPARDQPRTCTLANERMTRPDVGWPKLVAGRNEVKISMFFSAGISASEFSGADSTR